ncbi:unnamed protein product [Toxocara canis]|uniref:RING-type domain-containing protein n=1 Tax=Toxocara canis TaxID=6265 RepID=A0A183UMW6_TOXCA|nr:unnamed protein product [Toxocara canis]
MCPRSVSGKPGTPPLRWSDSFVRLHGIMRMRQAQLVRRMFASYVVRRRIDETTAAESIRKTLYSDYDEPRRPNFLEFDDPCLDVGLKTFQSADDETVISRLVPLAANEKFGSLEMYDATPSPQREEEVHFLDESPDADDHQGLLGEEDSSQIDFIDSADEAGFTADEVTFDNGQRSGSSLYSEGPIETEPRTRTMHASKSTSHLDRRERERIDVSRPRSPFFGQQNPANVDDAVRFARSLSRSDRRMYSSISYHDGMREINNRSLIDYDIIIQNHYNRCSSPGCRKYASEHLTARTLSVPTSSDDEDEEQWLGLRASQTNSVLEILGNRSNGVTSDPSNVLNGLCLQPEELLNDERIDELNNARSEPIRSVEGSLSVEVKNLNACEQVNEPCKEDVLNSSEDGVRDSSEKEILDLSEGKIINSAQEKEGLPPVPNGTSPLAPIRHELLSHEPAYSSNKLTTSQRRPSCLGYEACESAWFSRNTDSSASSRCPSAVELNEPEAELSPSKQIPSTAVTGNDNSTSLPNKYTTKIVDAVVPPKQRTNIIDISALTCSASALFCTCDCTNEVNISKSSMKRNIKSDVLSTSNDFLYNSIDAARITLMNSKSTPIRKSATSAGFHGVSAIIPKQRTKRRMLPICPNLIERDLIYDAYVLCLIEVFHF